MIRRHRGRTTAAIFFAGLLSAAAALFGATAPGAQAADLFSFDLEAGAQGYTMLYEEPAGTRYFEATVPEASSSMQTGPIGLGRAAVFWPGPVGGNAGSLILVLQPGAPPDVTAANYPYRAESRIGDDPPEATNTDLPGSTMHSLATPEQVAADAHVENATGDPGAFGPTTTTSLTKLEGGKGLAESRSVVENISLAAGLVTIESVTSTATATTDGAASDGVASTTVTGLKIAEQPARIDQDGLHIGEAGEPNPVQAGLNEAAKQAFEQAGAELVLSAPVKEVEGSTTTVSSGSLIFSWRNDGGYETIRIGGASASVAGAPGFDEAAVDLGEGDLGAGDVTDVGTDVGSTDSGSFSNDTFDTGTDLGDTGSLDTGAPIESAAGLTETPAIGSTNDVLPTQPVASIRGAIGAGWVIFGFAASCLFALGFKRLADDVLSGTGGVCPLDGDAG